MRSAIYSQPGETTVIVPPASPPLVMGTCSCCGGRVAVPSVVVVGQTDSTPFCLDCGARGAPPPQHGPVIPMVK